MEIFKRGKYLFNVERVKNDVNGNPKYQIQVIFLDGNNVTDITNNDCLKDYKRLKKNGKISISTYNIKDTIDGMVARIRTTK